MNPHVFDDVFSYASGATVYRGCCGDVGLMRHLVARQARMFNILQLVTHNAVAALQQHRGALQCPDIVLLLACKHGSMPVAQWVLSDMSDRLNSESIKDAWQEATKHHRTDLLALLRGCSVTNLTADAAFGEECLSWAFFKSNKDVTQKLGTLTWILDAFGLRSNRDKAQLLIDTYVNLQWYVRDALPMFSFLVENMHVTIQWNDGFVRYVFKCCSNGDDLGVLTKLGVSRENVAPNLRSIVQRALENHNWAMLQWLHDIFGFTRADIANGPDNLLGRIFMWESKGCEGDLVPHLQYLHDTWHFTLEDTWEIVRLTVEEGYKAVLCCLHDTYGLRLEHLWEMSGNAWFSETGKKHDMLFVLHIAVSRGDLSMVQTLHTVFGLTGDDVRGRNVSRRTEANKHKYNRVLREAIWYSNATGCSERVAIVAYLHTALGLTAADVEDVKGVRVAIDNKDAPMLQCLHDEFGITQVGSEWYECLDDGDCLDVLMSCYDLSAAFS